MRDEATGFHYRDGWFFKRMPDGSVRATKLASAHPDSEVVTQVIIDPDSWASVVASVSAKGEDGERFQAARRFHDGVPHE